MSMAYRNSFLGLIDAAIPTIAEVKEGMTQAEMAEYEGWLDSIAPVPDEGFDRYLEEKYGHPEDDLIEDF